MTATFWADILSAIPQALIFSFFIIRYSHSSHHIVKTAVASVLLLLAYLLTNDLSLIRYLFTAGLQFLFAWTGNRTTRFKSTIYVLLLLVLQLVFEFPIDLVILSTNPDFVSLQDMSVTFILTFRLFAGAIFWFCPYIAWLLCDKLFRQQTSPGLNRYLPFFLLELLLILTLVAIFTKTYTIGQDIPFFTACFGFIVLFLLVIDLLLVHLFRRIDDAHQLELEHRQAELLLALEEENYAALQEQTRSVRRLRHDMANQLQSIRFLLTAGNTKDAEKQLDDYYADVQALGNAVFSGNAIIDAVINNKRSRMEDLGIRFTYEGLLRETPPISPSALSSVVFNLLDNAIRACNAVEDDSRRFIDFSVLTQGASLLITCRNATVPRTAENAVATAIPTTAPDISREHGWGLNILQQIANRYDGRLELLNEGNIFSVSIWLPLSNEEGRT